MGLLLAVWMIGAMTGVVPVTSVVPESVLIRSARDRVLVSRRPGLAQRIRLASS